jgi:uncharacterized protein (TIGR03084 family)
MSVSEITSDLRAEHEALDSVVARLSEDQWFEPTPSPGWRVFEQVAHLTYFDGTATTAITEPDRFAAELAELMDAVGDGSLTLDEATLSWSAELAPAGLLDRWRAHRALLLHSAGQLGEEDRVPWYGPSMGARSFLTARLMETWAHGQDVVDAVGASRPATDRLRHVAQLGVITRGWSYRVRGADPPQEKVRVELTSPSGEPWTWNDDATGGVVRGAAEDFCLVVTQRRHVDDTGLRTEGRAARDWMLKAQAFAGGPSEGPQPRH